MPATRIQCLTFLTILTLVVAMPTLPVYDYVPRDAHALRLDTRTNEITIFSRDMQPVAVVRNLDALTKVSKRDSGSKCTLLDLEDAKRLPGWQRLLDTAKKNWGGGSYNLEVNPKDYPDRGATVCTPDAPVQLKLSEKPQCVTSTSKTQGKVAGTKGRITMEKLVGTEMTSEMTVTKVSVIATSKTFGVSVGIRGIASADFSSTISTQFTNALTTHQSKKVSSYDKQTFEFDSPPGATCHAEFSLKHCTQSGKGTVDYVAQGFVWFNFNDKTQGHYKWCLSIESTLANVKDRSSQMEFEAMMSSNTQGEYNAVCNGEKVAKGTNVKSNKKTDTGKAPVEHNAAKPQGKAATKT